MRRYNVITATDIGTFIVNRHDLGVGKQLLDTGIYERDELALLRGVVLALGRQRANLTMLDVGANIGVHSVHLAPLLGPFGKVHAFEAQRIVFNMLAGNVALNSLENVYCHHCAIGKTNGQIEIPQFDYSSPLGVGSVEFGEAQNEFIGQQRGRDPSRQELVRLVAIDGLGLDHVDLIKIDVEGMELDVLEGGRGLIERSRPVMFVEFLKTDRALLRAWLKNRGYRLFPFTLNYLAVHETCGLSLNGLAED